MLKPVSILGSAWVTPFGRDLESTWDAVHNGKEPPIVAVAEAEKRLWKVPVPSDIGSAWFRNPRLRRSSAISYYAAQAGSDALQDAGLTPETLAGKKVGLISAVSSGGVIYTRRFYEQIAEQGANNASPLLFPETVYNAPASHIAHLLNVTGITYTLVGDGSVGMSALQCAQSLLLMGEVDVALVIASEELDWVLCEAYATWRFLSRTPKIRLHASRGTILAEGAAAIVLGSATTSRINLQAHRGVTFFRQNEAGAAVANVVNDLDQHKVADFAVSSANGTFIDGAETRALSGRKCEIHSPKQSLGEALGAGALQQVVFANELIKRRNLNGGMVLSTGFNHQASGVLLTRN